MRRELVDASKEALDTVRDRNLIIHNLLLWLRLFDGKPLACFYCSHLKVNLHSCLQLLHNSACVR